MSDNEIIKSFICCIGSPKCNECAYRTFPENCKERMMYEILKLINRITAEKEGLKDACTHCPVLKVKSETISDLNEQIGYWQRGYNDLRQEMKIAKAEAVKEFAERLKKRETTAISCKRFEGVVSTDDIDELVKELSEGGTDG